MFVCLIVAVLFVSLPIISHAQQVSKKKCDPEKTLWPSNGNCTYDEDSLNHFPHRIRSMILGLQSRQHRFHWQSLNTKMLFL